jgi:hypothetical protein
VSASRATSPPVRTVGVRRRAGLSWLTSADKQAWSAGPPTVLGRRLRDPPQSCGGRPQSTAGTAARGAMAGWLRNQTPQRPLSAVASGTTAGCPDGWCPPRTLRQSKLSTATGLGVPQRPVGWQPSRFLSDRAEAERAFQFAERLGSVNAAAAELGTTWPSLRKAFARHGLGMPARNPEAVRQRAIAAARQRSGQPATPSLDPVFVALNPGALPARSRPEAELYQWVRREEQYATLGANVVVELYSESHARQPTTRAWAIIRRAERAQRRTNDRQGRGERRRTDRTDRADRADRADRTSRSHQPQERGMAADAR